MSNCESATCCNHPTESERLLKRDGVLYIVCVECGTEREEVRVVNINVPNMADYVNTDIPNRWGGHL